MKPIYLDNNATTLIDPAVLQVLIEAFESGPLNPSSIHAFGQKARARVAAARRRIAAVMGVSPGEIIFHSGATEGLNLALRSIGQGRVISSRIEHSAVYETLEALEDIEPVYLPVGARGAPELVEIEEALQRGASAIVLSAANSETGVLLDLVQVAKLAERYRTPFICDTTAAFGKTPLEFLPGIASMHFSAHKFHGPAGVGFSIFRRGEKIRPLITGGGQEFGLRSGTLSAALILALAKAVELAAETDFSKMALLRDQLESGILAKVPEARVNGYGKRLANTTNIAFNEMEGDALFMALDLAGVAVSLGSACASGALEPSRVIAEMGGEAMHSVRFSLSRMTDAAEIARVIEIVANLHAKVM